MMPLVSGPHMELRTLRCWNWSCTEKRCGSECRLSNVNCFWSTKSSSDRDQKNCSEKIGNTPEQEAIRVLNAVPWAS